MIRRSVSVENQLGLHARAAAKLVRLTSTFSCSVFLSREGEDQRINARSILGLLMLAAARGTRLVVFLDGKDEVEAADAVCRLFSNRFGEES